MTSPREGVFYFSSLIAYRENTVDVGPILQRRIPDAKVVDVVIDGNAFSGGEWGGRFNGDGNAVNTVHGDIDHGGILFLVLVFASRLVASQRNRKSRHYHRSSGMFDSIFANAATGRDFLPYSGLE